MPARMTALLLGLWVAFLPALGGASSFAAAVPMAMSHGDVGHDCDGCPDADMDSRACAFVCLSMAPFMTPAERGEFFAFQHAGYARAADPFLRGHLPLPDPAPPKTALR